MQIEQIFPYFADIDGTPLNSGFIYVGTTNANPEISPVTVFWDEALTEPALQPLRTINGFVVRNGTLAKFFTNTDFSITVKNKNSVLVSYFAGQSSLEMRLQSSIGSSLVGFLQAGAGAVARTSQDKMRDIINGNDYGITANGVTDDHTAFATAIAHLATLGGGTLVLPRGDILLNSTVQINCSGISIIGQGAAFTGTRVINGQTNAPAIQFGDGVNQYGRCNVRDFIVAQKFGVAPVAGNCGVKAKKQLDFRFVGLDASSFPASLFDGIRVEDSSATFGGSNRVDSCVNQGIVFLRCGDIHMTDSRSDGNGVDGIAFYGCEGVYFNGVTGWNNNSHAFRIASDGANHSFNMFFTNCIGDTSGSYNWNISNLAVAEFTACWGSTQKSTAVNIGASGFVFSGAQTRDIEMTGCIGLSNNAHGLQVISGTRIKIRGGQYGNPVSGNGKSIPADGINFQPGVSDVTVSAQCCGNSQYGVSISAGVSGIKVDGGEYTGNTVGAIVGITNTKSVRNADGVNPMAYGIISPPALPLTGVAVTNATGVDAMVYIRGGTITSIAVSGTVVAGAGDCVMFVPAGSTITPTYTVAPFWVWYGL